MICRAIISENQEGCEVLSHHSSKMENHVIICGYGRNGNQAANELLAHGREFIVIDSDHKNLIACINKPFRFIEGDATSDEILEQAHVAKAKALITTLPNDADNLFVALTARSLNSTIKIVSRASSESTEKKLKMIIGGMTLNKSCTETHI